MNDNEAEDTVSEIPRMTKRKGGHHRRQSSLAHMDNQVKQKRKLQREQVISEILETERTYVQQLGTLRNVFVKPLKELGDAQKEANQVNLLFNNIETIADFHRAFLDELSKPDHFCVSGVALTFLRFSDYMKLYTAYVHGYDNSLRAYRNLTENKRIRELIETQSQLPECNGLDLTSFLILPVQRIPRYELLLRELTKYAEPDKQVLKNSTSSDEVNQKRANPDELQLLRPIMTRPVSAPQTSPRTQKELFAGISAIAIIAGEEFKDIGTSPSASPRSGTPSPRTRSPSPSAPDVSWRKFSLAGKRASITLADAMRVGPLASLHLALEKIREIAVYVNNNQINTEVIPFTLIKLNKINQDTERVFEVDSAHRMVIVKKRHHDVMTRDFVITPETFCNCQLDPEDRTRVDIEFFKQQARLLRQKKTWRLRCANEGERERFYRLIQVHMLARKMSCLGSAFSPQPIRITEETKLLTDGLPVDRLAEQIHQEWVQQKQDLGWSYGPKVDEALKTHPSIVSYEELTSDMKKSNIDTVVETIACVFQLGFKIKPPSTTVSRAVHNEIAPELIQLVEFLAENTHDNWAAQKMRDGWTYAPVRNDAQKKHPLLVSYCDIPSYQQDYDRSAAMKVISGLIDLGYVITKIES